jgi:hypothetical protein
LADIDRVQEFVDLIATKIREPDLAAVKYLAYDPPAFWVADALLRAAEAGILEIRPSPGRGSNWALAYEGPLLVNASGQLVRSVAYWTHSVADKSRMFAHEAAISVAAAARLVLDFGYPLGTVQVESDDHLVDGVAFEYVGEKPRPILAVEAKVSDAEVRALVAAMSACGGVGDMTTHVDAIRGAGLRGPKSWFKNHHQKCLFLVSDPPVGFWAVSSEQPDGNGGKIYIARPVDARFVLESVPFGALRRDRLLGVIAGT